MFQEYHKSLRNEKKEGVKNWEKIRLKTVKKKHEIGRRVGRDPRIPGHHREDLGHARSHPANPRPCSSNIRTNLSSDHICPIIADAHQVFEEMPARHSSDTPGRDPNSPDTPRAHQVLDEIRDRATPSTIEQYPDTTSDKADRDPFSRHLLGQTQVATATVPVHTRCSMKCLFGISRTGTLQQTNLKNKKKMNDYNYMNHDSYNYEVYSNNSYNNVYYDNEYYNNDPYVELHDNNQWWTDNQPYYPPTETYSSTMPSLEDIVKSLAISSQSFQRETKVDIQNLEQQISQITTSVNEMISQEELTAQTESNPGLEACEITSEIWKSYDSPKVLVYEEEEEESDEEIVVDEHEEENKVYEPTPPEVEVVVEDYISLDNKDAEMEVEIKEAEIELEKPTYVTESEAPKVGEGSVELNTTPPSYNFEKYQCETY
ncbi:hypothetical protein LXL04_019182 [Taraxacum kok-saghyz]